MLGITRRAAVGALACVFAGTVTAVANAASIAVTKDPNCGCCQGWVEHLRAAGFVPSVNESNDLTALKTRLGVPTSLFSCHTAESEGYAIEGHVPAQAIRRLLAERPDAKGLAVAGMPIGSPGMEVPGRPDEEYAVVLFGAFGERTLRGSRVSRNFL